MLRRRIQALSDDDWQKALNVKLAGIRSSRPDFYPGMIERESGVILHISSSAPSSAL